MITFYPRDVGLWRSDFDFSDRANYPTKTFKDRNDLIKFIDGKIRDENFPVKFIEKPNHHFNTTHIVHMWTVMGWSREDQQ